MHPLLKHVLVLDIETASGLQTYDELSPEMQAHWDRKASFLRNQEELSTADLFEDRGAIYAEFGKIITIGIGAFFMEKGVTKFRVKSFADTDEKRLLTAFVELIQKFDQDNLKLCGHNGKEFDFPYICRRLIVNHIEIPWALDLGGKKPWEVNYVDTMELWKFGDRKNYTPLDLLAYLFGIPSSKKIMQGHEVGEYYYKKKDLEAIESYCKDDVVATARVFCRLKGLSLPSDVVLH